MITYAKDVCMSKAVLGNFLVYDFWTTPPSPLLSMDLMDLIIYHIDIIGHVAAAPGPLACASRSARPRRARGPNLTLNMYTNLLEKKQLCKMYKFRNKKLNCSNQKHNCFFSCYPSLFTPLKRLNKIECI